MGMGICCTAVGYKVDDTDRQVIFIFNITAFLQCVFLEQEILPVRVRAGSLAAAPGREEPSEGGGC